MYQKNKYDRISTFDEGKGENHVSVLFSRSWGYHIDTHSIIRVLWYIYEEES